MRAPWMGSSLIVLFSLLAHGQNSVEPAIDKVLYFSQADGKTFMQQVSNAIRAVTDLPATMDLAQKSLALHGTTDQVEVAEWLFVQLDQAPSGQVPPPGRTVAGKTLPGRNGSPEPVEILYYPPASTPVQMQETVNTIRAITEIVRLMPVPDQKAVALRGEADRVALAEWLFGKLEPTENSTSTAPSEFHFPLANDPSHSDVTRIFYLPATTTPQDLQKVVNEVRAATHVARLMPAPKQHALVLRATDSQVSGAAELIQKIETPPAATGQK